MEERVRDFILECGVYYIASMEGDQPRVRPFGTANVFEGKLYIQTGKKKDFFKQVMENPKVEICCFNRDKWMRLAGELVNDDRVEAKKAMLDDFPNLRAMYDENDDNTAVLYFKSAKGVFSSFSSSPETFEF